MILKKSRLESANDIKESNAHMKEAAQAAEEPIRHSSKESNGPVSAESARAEISGKQVSSCGEVFTNVGGSGIESNVGSSTWLWSPIDYEKCHLIWDSAVIIFPQIPNPKSQIHIQFSVWVFSWKMVGFEQ